MDGYKHACGRTRFSTQTSDILESQDSVRIPSSPQPILVILPRGVSDIWRKSPLRGVPFGNRLATSWLRRPPQRGTCDKFERSDERRLEGKGLSEEVLREKTSVMESCTNLNMRLAAINNKPASQELRAGH